MPNYQQPDIESAFYGRYSDARKQTESSIEDQVRECRDQAKRDGGFIPDANIFPDRDVRGATESRPALDRLLAIVRSGKATFKDLYIADTSRLARSSSFAPWLRKFFAHHNIRLHFVENGMTSGTSGFELQHTFQSFIDEQYSKQLGEKVSRAQVGRVLKGNLPSGKCYGYRGVNEEHPTKIGKWGRPEVISVKQVPYQKEVDVVLNIYKMYAAGEGGYCHIARQLWQKGIDPPRKGCKNEGKGWGESAVMRILNNERYIGKVVFGKKKQSRNPDTLKLVQRPNLDSPWTVYHDPTLQIVSGELWAAVKARQALVRDKVGNAKAGGLGRMPACIAYLFSGLLRCGTCGNSMVLTSGNYKCSNARRKMGCSNTGYIERVALERHLIDAIVATIRSGANFNNIKSMFMAKLAIELKLHKEVAECAVGQKEALVEEKRMLETALHNLAEEVATYGGDEAMRTLRQRKGARLAVVTDTLTRAEAPAPQHSEKEIDAFLQKALAKLADVLLEDPLTSKQELLKRISSLTLTPMVHGGEPAYGISGDMKLFSGEEAMMLLPSGTSTQEHHPFVISLGGLVVKLDSHGKVIAIVWADAIKTEKVPTRHLPDLGEELPAKAA